MNFNFIINSFRRGPPARSSERDFQVHVVNFIPPKPNDFTAPNCASFKSFAVYHDTEEILMQRKFFHQTEKNLL